MSEETKLCEFCRRNDALWEIFMALDDYQRSLGSSVQRAKVKFVCEHCRLVVESLDGHGLIEFKPVVPPEPRFGLHPR